MRTSRASSVIRNIYFGPHVFNVDSDNCPWSLEELLEEAEAAVEKLEKWIDEQDSKGK